MSRLHLYPMRAASGFFLLAVTMLTGLSSGAGVRVQGFSFNGVSNRFITPNSDGKNDNIVFKYDNPRDSSGSIKIYSMRGHLLTTIPVNAGDLSETWDGRANGALVPTGVYVYVIHVESVLVSGAVVVIR